MSDLLSPRIVGVAPSKGPFLEAQLRAGGYDGPIHRMNLNECPFGPSPKVAPAVAAVLAGVNRYPDNQYQALRAAIGGDLDVPGEHIFFASGSDMILQAVGDMTMDPDRSAVIPDPSFQRYSLSVSLRGGQIITVPVAQDGRNDVDALVAAVRPDTRLLFAATPNNPTGQMLSEAEVARLAENTPDHVLLVLDEAYYEFARHAGGVDCVQVLKKYRPSAPWVVLRTFSKAYGLAGMRIGYAIVGSDEVMSGFHIVRTAFNLSAASQAAALAAYQDQDHCRWLVKEVSDMRDAMVEGLRKLGLDPLPTVGNFIAVAMPGPGAKMVQALQDRGILISPIRTPTPGFENFIRITLSLPEDNEACLSTIAELLASGEVYPAE